MGEYAGESIAKKVARVRIYLRAKQMIAAAGHRGPVTALVLAGPEAAEIGCLAHILKPATIFVVDRDQKCVDHFFKKMDNQWWEELTCEAPYVGDLHTFKPTEHIHFANIDLMGNLNGDIGKQTAPVLAALTNGSVAAVTYLRGRETGETRRALESMRTQLAWANLPRHLRRLLGSDKGRSASVLGSMTTGLFVSILKKLRHREGADKLGVDFDDPQSLLLKAVEMEEDFSKMFNLRFWPIGTYAYRAEVSPMGVTLAQLIIGDKPEAFRRALFCKGAVRPTRERRLIASIIKKDPMIDLLNEAKSLAVAGHSNQAIAEIFNVSVSTMAAWKAHRTMGTYAA